MEISIREMPCAEQKVAYEILTIPESKTVAGGGLTSAAKVDVQNQMRLC
jgi:hypothetical protein